jgi:hypothetical protein
MPARPLPAHWLDIGANTFVYAADGSLLGSIAAADGSGERPLARDARPARETGGVGPVLRRTAKPGGASSPLPSNRWLPVSRRAHQARASHRPARLEDNSDPRRRARAVAREKCRALFNLSVLAFRACCG